MNTSLPLHQAIRGLTYKQATNVLRNRGITPYQCELIREAEEEAVRDDRGYLVQEFRIQSDYDPRGEIEALKILRRKDLVVLKSQRNITGNAYWLTSDGKELWNALRACYSSGRNLVEVNGNKTKAIMPFDPENVDIDVSRDGLLGTASKLWKLWTQRKAIERAKQTKWMEEFEEGQSSIEEGMAAIAALDFKDYRLTLPPEKPLFTEEELRERNHQYWLSGGTAFWLNPNAWRNIGQHDLPNYAAENCPAPDWWVMPTDYQPKTVIEPYIDVIADSLKAPSGFRPATAEEIAEKYSIKEKEMVLDDLLAELEAMDGAAEKDYDEWVQHYNEEQKSRKEARLPKGMTITVDDGKDFYIVERGQQVRGFTSRREADQWLNDMILEERRAAQARIRMEEDRREVEEARKRMNAEQAAKSAVHQNLLASQKARGVNKDIKTVRKGGGTGGGGTWF